jgi:3-hydroxyisobutyrate dehydrogenase-like beta-hydroxyacid dehydrogenase
MSGDAMVVAVLGLGEAGSVIAADLCAAGAAVRGYDPLVRAGPGITDCADDADACRGAAVVISLTCAHEAEAALVAARPGIGPGAIYADLNTASAEQKAHLAGLAAAAGLGFADVALMSPVPGNGLRTPMLAAGPAAAEFARVFGALGAAVEVLAGPPGAAAARKLVRSVFYKGLAAAITESLRAARAAGCEGWLRDSICRELTGASAATLERLEQGSVRHAVRRVDEMAAAAEQLRGLGVPPRVARASEQWLRQLAEENDGHPAGGSTPRAGRGGPSAGRGGPSAGQGDHSTRPSSHDHGCWPIARGATDPKRT